MIHPEVRITDLDVDGFAHLCGVISARDMRTAAELTVLHDGGRVLQVVGPDGAVDDVGARIDDPAARADELLASRAVDRVVLLDRSQLDDLATVVVDAAAASPVQSDLLEAAHHADWSSPGVTTAPEPPAWPWTPVQDALTELGSGWLLLAAWRGEECALRLMAEVRAGLVARITSPAAAPARSSAIDLLKTTPIPTAVLLVDIEVLDRVLLDPRPLDALRRVLDENEGVLYTHGLEELLWP